MLTRPGFVFATQYDLALRELSLMRASLLSWYTPGKLPPYPAQTTKPPPLVSHAPILSIPLPPPNFFHPPTLADAVSSARPAPASALETIPLVLAVQQYTLGSLFRSNLSSDDAKRRIAGLASALAAGGSPLEWRRRLNEHCDGGPEAEAVRKRVEGIMSSVFGTVTKGCVGAEAVAGPDELLLLRSRALLWYATSGPLRNDPAKLASFYDQARKVLLLYGRQAEASKFSEVRINDAVKRTFEEVVDAMGDAGRDCKTWRELCDVAQHIAKRADDLPFVERVSTLLGGKGTSPASGPVDSESQASQVCARVIHTLSALEMYVKTSEDNGRLGDQLLRTINQIPLLSVLRARPASVSAETHKKVDKVLERLRYVAVRRVRSDRRLDQLVTPKGLVKAAPANDVDAGLLKLLDALAAHAEAVVGGYKAEQCAGRAGLAGGAVEALLVLGYSSLVVDEPAWVAASFGFLERAIPLIAVASARVGVPTAESIPAIDFPAHHYSVRTLASGYYNLGGALFNANKPAAAVPFLRRAAQISADVVASTAVSADVAGMLSSLSLEDDKTQLARDEARADFAKQLSKRCEVLALAHHGAGDKAAALTAYASAIATASPALRTDLHAASASTPVAVLAARDAFAGLVKLIQRATKLAAFDLLRPGAEVGLGRRLREAGWEAGAAGIVLELQLGALDGAGDRAEASKVLAVLVEDLLGLYTAERFPLRRARVLVRMMQHQCAPGQVAQDLAAAATAAEIDALCSRDSWGEDAALAPSAFQHVAFSHLWLAFHAHQAHLPRSSEAVAGEARSALRLLRLALDPDLPASPSAPLPPRASHARRTSASAKKDSPLRKMATVAAPATATRRSARAAASAKTPAAATKSAFKTPQVARTLPGSRRPPLVELRTPPSSALHSAKADERATTPRRGEPRAVVLDDPERCYAALEMMASLLGVLGYALLKIGFLKFLRRLAVRNGPHAHAGFVTASAVLGREYVLMGKTSRAGLVFAQAEGRIQSCAKMGLAVPDSARVTYALLYAEYLAVLGNHDRAAVAYAAALAVAETIEAEETGPAALRIVDRTLLLQRVATAAGVCSVMLQRKGDLARSLNPALQALRVWTRALSNISRLSAKESPITVADAATAFTAPSTGVSKAALPEHAAATGKKYGVSLNGPSAGLSWQLGDALGAAMLRVAALYSLRGTPKSAEWYADQAVEFAADVGSGRLLARAVLARAQVRMLAGRVDDAAIDLTRAQTELGSGTCPEAVEAHRLAAELHLRQRLNAEAHSYYVEAQRSLDGFVQAAAEGETALAGAVKNGSPLRRASVNHSPAHQAVVRILSPGQLASVSPSPEGKAVVPTDRVLPSLQAYLLRMRVGLLRLQRKGDEERLALRLLAKVVVLEEDRADEAKLLATIQLQDLVKRFAADPVLGMLPDSVLSMPALNMPATKAVAPRLSNGGLSAGSMSHALKEIELLLAKAVGLSVCRAEPAKLRELSLAMAAIRALQTSVGKGTRKSASAVAAVLDLGLAVTLRRDMLDAIEHKVADSAKFDDLRWPPLESAAAVSLAGAADNPMTGYWLALRDRYRAESADPILTDPALPALLPAQWTTVSLHLSRKQDHLILVRHRRAEEPVVLQLPLDRLARREGDDDAFTYDVAAGELGEIIAASNETASRAKHVRTKEDRAEWWAERKELDDRLKDLCQTIEDAWLGAFKGAFHDARGFAPEAVAAFKARVEKVLKRSIVRSASSASARAPASGPAARLRLDEHVLRSLAALDPASREEDLEDLFYFLMESSQFAGVPVACDETDVDQVVVDLRAALEELHGSAKEKDASGDVERPEAHTFLLLDKELQAFPWESLPCLRGRSVSRLPALSFLRDRLDLAAVRGRAGADPADPAATATPHEIVVDARRTGFVLNPGGDLKSTQATFEPMLASLADKWGWKGITGRAPSEEEMRAFLLTKDLVLYFGHGGAEQFVRSQTLRHLPHCATTMLWGCSSGFLKPQGDFDPVGTAYHYLLGGCPALVANLWDVTDKDIDKFAASVFAECGLDGERERGAGAAGGAGVTLGGAVARGREACHLKYLNGAATVVYGVPVRFELP